MKFRNIVDLLTALEEHAFQDQSIHHLHEDIEAALSVAKAERCGDFEALWNEHSKWSQDTFGTDAEVGPIGPLKHLAKEAMEAEERPADFFEYADCLLLVMDSARRAGLTPMTLITAAHLKLETNKKRKWPEPKDGEPREHIQKGNEQ